MANYGVSEFFGDIFSGIGSAANAASEWYFKDRQLDYMQDQQRAETLYKLGLNPYAQQATNGVPTSSVNTTQILTYAILGVGAAFLYKALK